MTYINKEDLRDSWPVEIWLRIFTTPETITVDWYREKYDKKEYWEKKFWDRAQMLFEYEQRAQFYPEFSKISGICYAINDWPVQVLTWDEVSMLNKLNELFRELDETELMKQHILCWFNLYQHDIPYLWKRMVINWVKPDHHLRIAKIPVYNINKFIRDLNYLWKQTSFSAELPLIILTVLWERAEWYDYSAANSVWLLDKTRQCRRKICNLFNS